MSNSFGNVFKITTFGESHGPAIGVVIDGCPPGLRVNPEDIAKELARRRPGQSRITTQRRERDAVEILSGMHEGKTLGSPIALLIRNEDTKSGDYNNLKNTFRPSHADFTYEAKYGRRDPRGGGRASARETVSRVAAGVFAKKLLAQEKIEILAYVRQIYHVIADILPETVTSSQVESNIVRCPDTSAAKKMIETIEDMSLLGDSVGGIIECIIRNVPAGLGSPVFDKLEARLAQAMLSIPATRGFEVGEGFNAALFTGNEHNDAFVATKGKIRTKTNHSGGIQGGISNGMPILFRVAFKPTATILKEQDTVDSKGKKMKLQVVGRHDPCVLPRAVPIVEAMAALVLADEWLRQKTLL
ncbi:chorismate synthase [Candidatus Peregrinibacteria bacterium]|nr:chorismate synthase [Candidatus Peregrinibacteria bacterium]